MSFDVKIEQPLLIFLGISDARLLTDHDLARVSPINGAQRRILEAIAARPGLGEHARPVPSL